MTPPTYPCPTLSADAEPAHKRACAETIFPAQCDVTKSALQGLMGLIQLLVGLANVSQSCQQNFASSKTVFVPGETK